MAPSFSFMTLRGLARWGHRSHSPSGCRRTLCSGRYHSRARSCFPLWRTLVRKSILDAQRKEFTGIRPLASNRATVAAQNARLPIDICADSLAAEGIPDLRRNTYWSFL